MRDLTDFEVEVKMRLLQMNKNLAWLVEQVHDRTGYSFDNSYLWKILKGDRKGKKIVMIIREILDLPEQSCEKEHEK